MSSEMKTTALVLGATGGIGGAVARKLSARGWRIRALNRDALKASRSEPAFEWVQGDAMNAGDVLRAAEGVNLIIHAVNPPGYRNWETLVLPMLDNSIAAARTVGARIVLPGNVYNFGPDALPAPTEESPQHPLTKKGAVRVEMEKRLEAGSQAGVGAIILRAGDFFGPGATANSWFSSGLVTPGKPIGTIKNPGRRGIGHQWTYLPDMAETVAQLIDRAERLPSFAVYHMDGFWDADGMQMAEAIKRVAGGKAKIGRFPWWIVPLAAPSVPIMRELKEMRYLWKVPLRMSNAKLVGELGKEPQTPIDEAVRASLVALGCLPEQHRDAAVAFIGHSLQKAR
ncbi:NAD(P)H-binding protein [Rhizobium hidalgonense]|uniref:NAD(P)H-binding protein n=1 Tax=Rhizobium hidalgonense TaxID=1538159 RepID=UPI00027D38F8|nr:NAD(P)H-binding protein [Rhizobium hidalgonense]EJC77193.1 nucleoside-diphosphate-sugar epimerase [Rhizobium leguminosarum bv. trifolii WSM2012]QKK22969.1 NAD(P)H-binding protein [Rhizobium hidalgonense]RWX09806.1 NAD-dependent epimerase/dehydratase family protein [Rhizobium hidalgonense]